MYRVADGTPFPKWVRMFGNAGQTHPDYPKVRRMAEIISEAVNRLLPEGFETREERGEIALLRRGKVERAIGVAATYLLDPADDPFADEYETADAERPDDDQFVRSRAEQVLNTVQDWITEETTWPWPSVEGRRTVMPDHCAEVKDRILRVWYEADSVPTTEVVEVRLPDCSTVTR